MLNERTTDLIHASIDGELTGDEHTELRIALEQSAEAQKFQADMVRIDQMIASLPEVEPPAGLTRRILDSIHLPSKSRFEGWSVLFGKGWFTPASYGLAVAAGVLVAVGVVQMSSPSQGDVRNLVGTMVRDGNDVFQPVSGELVIDLAMLQGQVRLKNTDQAWALEFDLQSQDAVEISVDTLESGLEFDGFARQDGSAGLENVEVSEQTARVINKGDHRFVLFLRHKALTENHLPGIGVAVSHGGAVIYQGQLESRG